MAQLTTHTNRYTPSQEEAFEQRLQRAETYLVKQSEEIAYRYAQLVAALQTMEEKLDALAVRAQNLEDPNAS